MKTQSTYSLLIKSEEKGRSFFETAIYALVMVASVVSVGQFATETVTLSGQAAAKKSSSTLMADAAVQLPAEARG
jgi:hypothetical protein